MIDVLLIQPPIRDFYLTAKRTMPYGLAAIAGALEVRGFSVRIVDALATRRNRLAPLPVPLADVPAYYGPADRSPFGLFSGYRHFGYSFAHLERLIRDHHPLVVGISSLFTPYEAEALETADRVRAVLPKATIVMGGHHPTHWPERVLSHPSVDIVVRGEGEASLPDLVAALKDKRPIESVPGVCFRDSSGGLHVSPPAFVASADAFPRPAFHRMHSDYYRRKQNTACVVVTSRGCPMNCSYCCMGRHAAFPYRRRPVADVMAEIETAAAAGDLGFIDFEDENLSFDRAWFLALLDALCDRFPDRSAELRAMNGLYPPALDPDLISRMAAAGFRELNLALGTVAAEQLVRFNRKDVRAEFERCLEAAAANGMTSVGYIIAGAPNQPPEASVDDLLYLAGKRVLAGLSVFYPAPGSADFERCRRMGLLPESVTRMRSSALPISQCTTRRDAVTLMRLSRVLNFIKGLIDNGDGLPEPAPPTPEPLANDMGRVALGLKLLSWFRYDGRLRGVTREGRVFEHGTNPKLVRRFLSGLEAQPIHGVRRRP